MTVLRHIEQGVYDIVTGLMFHHEFKLIGSDVPPPPSFLMTTTSLADKARAIVSKQVLIDPALDEYEVTNIINDLHKGDSIQIPHPPHPTQVPPPIVMGFLSRVIPGTYVLTREWQSYIGNDPDAKMEEDGFVRGRFDGKVT